MQVFFGDLTATDVNVFNDTTPANNDRITCVAPDYSQQEETPPVTVDVKVVNMTSGKESTAASGFTYGDALYISGNTPSEAQGGRAGHHLRIGFRRSAAGISSRRAARINSRSSAFPVPSSWFGSLTKSAVQCSDTAGKFRVVLLESNLEVVGGDLHAPRQLAAASFRSIR